jgi:small subunit ribosomal protein S17
MDNTNPEGSAEQEDIAAAPSALPTATVQTHGTQAAIERDPHVWLPEHSKSHMRTGRVVSAKMQKTVVIAVDRLVRHRLYKKIMRRTNKFVAHDELNCKAGDVVRILETRPISKTKRWRVVEVLSRASQA